MPELASLRQRAFFNAHSIHFLHAPAAKAGLGYAPQTLCALCATIVAFVVKKNLTCAICATSPIGLRPKGRHCWEEKNCLRPKGRHCWEEKNCVRPKGRHCWEE